MIVSRTRFLVLYVLLCLIWGSTWVVIRIGSDAALPPFLAASIRFGIAALFLWGWMIAKRVALPHTSREWWTLLVNGVLAGGGSFSIVYWTSQYVPSGIQAVIFGTMPLWTILLSNWIFGRDKLSWHKMGGIVLGLAGLMLIFLPDLGSISNETLLAMALMLVAPLISAFSLVLTKNYTKSVSPVAINWVTTSVGSIVLTIVAMFTSDLDQLRLTPSHIGTILYLAIFGTIFTFSVYYQLLQDASAVTMSMIALVTPLIAVLAGWVFLQEQLFLHTILGAIGVLGGVWLAITDPEA